MSPKALTYTIRSLQASLAVTTISLAVVLIVDQETRTNGSLNYGVAVGSLSLLGAVAGIVSLFEPILQGLIMILVDSVVSTANLAGGLLFAIKLEGVDCLNQSMEHMKAKLIHITLLNSDCPTPELDYNCLSWDEGDGFLQRRCRWATAAAVVMFLSFFIILVGGLLEYLGGRRKRTRN
ncbi:hypothetical protein IQ07DRAFT_680074 [Pyrenochaeta sp. DS3sAY3a]|nr:hypothetical protein IQ07DRAFT_680074 [Pyrenochaeta sp. DS3sAY3a]